MSSANQLSFFYMSASKTSTTGKIVHNSLWGGLEQVAEAVVFIGTNIAVARYLGPTKLGYFSFINLFVTVVTRTSGMGLANATRKYMSEYLAQDEPGIARAVYGLAYRYQLLSSVLIAAVGVVLMVVFGEPGYRLMACILLISIIPGIMSWVPAQANTAFEDIRPNTITALWFIATYAVMITLTIVLNWDLVGIAASLFVGRTVEVVLRTIPLHRRLRAIPLGKMSDELVARIRRFCVEAFGVQLLMSVVWDRSEILFLKAYSGLEQIAFYSVSFGLANNLLLIPRTFGAATGISLMVELSRDATRADSIVKKACRYLLFVVFPIHLGAAAITRSAVGFAYGIRYSEAVPVLMIASILAMPKAFQEIAEILIKTADKQKKLLIWYSVAGVVNIVLDWILVKRYGAVGAAWGNGIAQTLGVIAIWVQARRLYVFHFPMLVALRLLVAGGVMAGVAFYISHAVAGLAGIVLAIAAAGPVYLLMVKLVRGLEGGDRTVLEPLGNRLPGPLRRLYQGAIVFATPDPVVE